jgi:hypothetical protein
MDNTKKYNNRKIKFKSYKHNFHTTMIYFSSIGYNYKYNYKNYSKHFGKINCKTNNTPTIK